MKLKVVREKANLEIIFWSLDCFSIWSGKLEGLLHNLRYTCSRDMKVSQGHIYASATQ